MRTCAGREQAPQVRNRPRVRLYGAVPGRRLPGVGRSGASKKIVIHRGIHSDISTRFATCKTHDARHAAKPLLITERMPQ